MSDLNLSILGFPAVNPDLRIELRDPATKAVVKQAQPFLDGTVRISRLDPGTYELAVTHANLVTPVLIKPIRVLPVGDTKIQVLIDPSRFRNLPIEDIPDANLGPVSDAAQSVAETVLPLAQKRAGEAITASDWNAMAASIRELALSVGELTRLVSPVGHDHPELERKTQELGDNFTGLLEQLSGAMTELQRQIQAERYRKQVETVLTAAQVDPSQGSGKEFLDIVARLGDNVTDTPFRFGRAARTTGIQLATKLEQLLDAKADDELFVNSAAVKQLSDTVDLLKQQQTTTPADELAHNRKVDRVLGSGGLIAVLGKER
jgi:hypothetical protein